MRPQGIVRRALLATAALSCAALPAIALAAPSVRLYATLTPEQLGQLSTTIGPLHLTYYERPHGRRKTYHPEGILLPETCPRGGFPFAVSLAFADGSHASASTTVPCPGRSRATRQPQSERALEATTSIRRRRPDALLRREG
jgi:hypothetical protein